MTQFLIRRIFWAIFLFFVATIITYLIFWVIPADPAQLAAGKSATPADIARVRHFLHLDEPIWRQYLRFVWQLIRHGSLGESFVNRQSVDTIIGKDAPVTASLVFGGAASSQRPTNTRGATTCWRFWRSLACRCPASFSRLC